LICYKLNQMSKYLFNSPKLKVYLQYLDYLF
jgi:hypothetical protein